MFSAFRILFPRSRHRKVLYYKPVIPPINLSPPSFKSRLGLRRLFSHNKISRSEKTQVDQKIRRLTLWLHIPAIDIQRQIASTINVYASVCASGTDIATHQFAPPYSESEIIIVDDTVCTSLECRTVDGHRVSAKIAEGIQPVVT